MSASGAGVIDGRKLPRNVAIVCDWLTELGGAEQVVRELHEMFPGAPIYTSQYRHRVDKYFLRRVPKYMGPMGEFNKLTAGPRRREFEVRTGWLNLVPAGMRRVISPLRQSYFKNLDLSRYDLVISVTGCDAKYVKTKTGAHLSFCHAPTQYYWGKYEEYLENPGFSVLDPVARFALRVLSPRLRARDLEAAERPDKYVTISRFSAGEIKKYYKREAEVIAPPVDVKQFAAGVLGGASKRVDRGGRGERGKTEQRKQTFPQAVEKYRGLVRFLEKNRGDFYVNYSRQVSWKNLDVAVEACVKTGHKLLLIGDGPEHRRLKKFARFLEKKRGAKNSIVYFLPWMPQDALIFILEYAKAFVFPSKEPFGIAPVEALAAGCPVVALGAGGALDYVKEGKNGIFYGSEKSNHEGQIRELERALNRFDKVKLASRRVISKSVEKYDSAKFKEKMLKYIYENF